MFVNLLAFVDVCLCACLLACLLACLSVCSFVEWTVNIFTCMLLLCPCCFVYLLDDSLAFVVVCLRVSLFVCLLACLVAVYFIRGS